MRHSPNAENLADAIDLLKPEQPLLLVDAMVATDGDHAVTSFYLDIGLEKARRRPPYLLKATEAKHGLEHAANIQLSAPSKFRKYGETLIRDEQEGQAQRETKTKDVDGTHDKQSCEQQEALELLGVQGVSVRASNAGSSTDTKSIAFGADSWMYCTSIAPEARQREEWRASFPDKYDHESAIRQPRKFAFALGAMFADQSGPQGKRMDFTHPVGIQSFHDTQLVVHGPVWYTDDVLGFLESRQDDPYYALIPQFLKHSKHRAQREYRFVLRSERPVNGETLLLRITGEMRDTIAPPGSAGTVAFRRVPKDATVKGSFSTKMKPTTNTLTRRRRDWREQTSMVRANGQVVGEEKSTTEQVITVTTQSPADTVATSHDGPVIPAMAEVHERGTRERKVAGVEEEIGTFSRSRIYTIDASQVDGLFTLEVRDEAAALMEAAQKPMSALASPGTNAGKAVEELVRKTTALESRAQIGSACWHSIWPIFNLHECFGADIVASLDIKEDKFVAIKLKKSESGSGEILVGPEGTFAYVLTRVQDGKRHVGNGRIDRLIVFPDATAMAAFKACGWTALEDEG